MTQPASAPSDTRTMNRKSVHDRATLIQLFSEGMGVEATVRVTGISKNTILRNMYALGLACEAYQHSYLRHLPCKRIQVDETWSFVGSKNKNTPPERQHIAGDVYTWTSICQDTKLVPVWLVGTREAVYANLFMKDLASRFQHRIQITSDGHRPYPEAVEQAFGKDVDYVRTIKNYDCQDNNMPFITKQRVQGRPNVEAATTNHVERHNLTMRMCNRRLGRKTNAFSKKMENHKSYLAIYFMYYNFVRIHQTLRVTPAMEAGITDRVWSYKDMAELVEWNFKVI